MSNKNEAVRVCIRVRPMSQKEVGEGHTCVVKMSDRGEVFVQKPFA